MRSYQIEVDSKFNMTGVLLKRGKIQKQTQKESAHVTTEEENEMMRPQAKVG